MMWELDYLTAAGSLRSDVALRVEELLATADPDRAAVLMDLIESAVAPVSGGLSEDAPAVVTAVVAGLPRMSPESRPEALFLLTQIIGSASRVDSPAAVSVGHLIEGALPMLAAIIESGSAADIAQGIDLISLASAQSRTSAERAVFYLSRIASVTSGAIKKSAELELTEVGKPLA